MDASKRLLHWGMRSSSDGRRFWRENSCLTWFAVELAAVEF